MSAESGMGSETFPAKHLKEPEAIFCSQAYAYYPKLTEDEISQQSADHLPWFHINPVEFDGIRIQAEMVNPKLEQEVQP